MQTIRITTSQNIDIDYEVASVGDRILGYLVDFAIFFFLYIIALFGLGLSALTNRTRAGFGWVTAMIIIVVLAYAFYDLVTEFFMNGQSFGKRIMKTRVISLNGARPTLSQFLIRWLLRLVDMSLTTGLGAIVAVIATDKNQRIGDIAAGTVVVKTIRRTGSEFLAFSAPAGSYEPSFPEATQLSEQDIKLIHEVLRNYYKSRNPSLVYEAANRVKELLGIAAPRGMEDHQFLSIIVKDHNYLLSNPDEL